eukprot:8528775-Pyramimonas_sp.AAC.1
MEAQRPTEGWTTPRRHARIQWGTPVPSKWQRTGPKAMAPVGPAHGHTVTTCIAEKSVLRGEET